MARTIRIGSWSLTLPDWAPARVLIGLGLIAGGFLGFLPVLGFWMIPLGIAVLSYDVPYARLLRQRFMSWWRGRSGQPPDDDRTKS